MIVPRGEAASGFLPYRNSIDELNAVSGGSLWDHVQKALDGNLFDRISKQSHPWEDGQKQ